MAHDVVFAQIRARLHFDEMQGNAPTIFNAVLRAQRDVDRLVFADHVNIFVHRDVRSSAHDNPMFGAVMMALQ